YHAFDVAVVPRCADRVYAELRARDGVGIDGRGRLVLCARYCCGLWKVTLLCATSVFSVSLWLRVRKGKSPQRHREHRGCTEKSKHDQFLYSLLNHMAAR